MRELDQVHPVALRVVSVNFFAALEVKQTDAKVFAPSHQVLTIMADINRVYLLFL